MSCQKRRRLSKVIAVVVAGPIALTVDSLHFAVQSPNASMKPEFGQEYLALALLLHVTVAARRHLLWRAVPKLLEPCASSFASVAIAVQGLEAVLRHHHWLYHCDRAMEHALVRPGDPDFSN